MKFAYYTAFKNDHSDRSSMFCIWLYYLITSGSFSKEDDCIYIVTDESSQNTLKSSNIYKFIVQLKDVVNSIKFINIPNLSENEYSFVKYFPPIFDVMKMGNPDYIFYCDICNLIKGNIRDKFTNAEEIPAAYVMLEHNITDDAYFSSIKDSEWYSQNKKIIDELPAISSSLFCIKSGSNETSLLKSIFENVSSGFNSDSLFNKVLYSHSQYLSEKCYIELLPELFFNSVEINKLDSKKDIVLLKNIDMEVMNETLLMTMLCKLENL
jgi:hypothetical protein